MGLPTKLFRKKFDQKGKIAHCPGSNPGRRIKKTFKKSFIKNALQKKKSVDGKEKEPEVCLSAVTIRILYLYSYPIS